MTASISAFELEILKSAFETIADELESLHLQHERLQEAAAHKRTDSKNNTDMAAAIL